MRIIIDSIPHSEQRYDTIGDWVFGPETGNLLIKVSSLDDWKKELLVGIHELIEAALCKDRGIREEDVTTWDKDHPGSDEPGALQGAPYWEEHAFAEVIERQVAKELGVRWESYERACKEVR